MSFRITKIIAWLTLILAPIVMVMGHLGEHELRWKYNYISTFAASAPKDYLITAAILLSAVSLVCIGVLFSLCSPVKHSIVSQISSMLFGISASGLVVLARYEERAIDVNRLKKMGYAAIRTQSFHDTGLLLFFYGAVLALLLSGFVVILQTSNWFYRINALIISIFGPLAYIALASAWPKYVTFIDNSAGVKQRAAFLILWLGSILLLFVRSRSYKTSLLTN